MKKQSAVKIVLYMLYILSGAYTAFGIFKYSYPPTAARKAVTGFFGKLGVDIGITGSEIIYHFFGLAFAAASVLALFFLFRKEAETKGETKGMFISGAVVLLFTVLYLLGYLITNKYMHIFEFIGYVISYLTFAVICGRRVFKKIDK